MNSDILRNIDRRDFLKLTGAATLGGLSQGAYAAGGGRVCVILDPSDTSAASGPAKRAAGQIQKALSARGIACAMEQAASGAAGSAFCIVAASPQSQLASGFPREPEVTAVESVRLSPGKVGQTPAILISARDVRGLVYGLLELAEQIQYSPNPIAALQANTASEEKPANEIRSVGRYFCCEIEDKPWYYDKSFWGGYLDSLVANRFNRFNLGFGLEYDFPRGVTGDYFHLVYPYMVDVPGYPDVRVMQLTAPDGKRLAKPVEISKAEREKNFDMLRYIAAETGARGLQFQLGIWTHAYAWTDSPDAYHHIEGLTPENHAAYCRDALAIILKECPEIQGLTMRVHGESGIPEGSYPFWKTLFEAIPGAGRTIEIDMHAKGVSDTMIDIANATGMPVKLGAKYSAEHQSLGYQQADIRALEIPHGNLNKTDQALFSLSSGSRLFTRYGYADFLREGVKYKLLFRLWPGTQRHLLPADPEMAAAYGRTSSFCGAVGMDLMEPLTFKGREGSGHTGGRCAYADTSLNPKYDWQKYDYYYRVWGRKLYNPDANPEAWRRYLRSEFAAGAVPVETSVANASRILALLTSAHLDSASNHDLWYELPTNMPIVLGSEPSPYNDTPTPKCFGTVTPLDPQMFSTVNEYAKELLDGEPSAKYSPIEVAQWIEDCVAASREALEQARQKTKSQSSPEFRRIEEDVLIQIGLGTYFANKLRSGVLYAVWEQTGDAQAGKLALEHYRKAREAWATMADRAARVYMSDVSYGRVPKRRGHWKDRIPGIDTDVTAMEAKLQSPAAPGNSNQNAAKAVAAATGRPSRPEASCSHTPPQQFQPGQPLTLALDAAGSGGSAPTSVRLMYRHVDQAERWTSTETQGGGGSFSAAIPADYTQSEFPLEYYFEWKDAQGAVSMIPGFNKTLSNQPYFTVMRNKA